MAYITLDGLKTALTEMKNHIVDKFYNKVEVDNKLNQFQSSIEESVLDEMDTAINTTIPTKVDTLVTDKLTAYEATLDATIQEKVDAKPLDTSDLITKTELDPTKVITSDNLASKNVATINDLPTALDGATFTAMVTDLTTEGGSY